MDMCVLFVVCFDFQTGEINAVPAGYLNRELAAGRAGGVDFVNLELFAARRTPGRAGPSLKLQRRTLDDAPRRELAEVELDGFSGSVRERPNGHFDVRDAAGAGFLRMDK